MGMGNIVPVGIVCTKVAIDPNRQAMIVMFVQLSAKEKHLLYVGVYDSQIQATSQVNGLVTDLGQHTILHTALYVWAQQAVWAEQSFLCQREWCQNDQVLMDYVDHWHRLDIHITLFK